MARKRDTGRRPRYDSTGVPRGLTFRLTVDPGCRWCPEEKQADSSCPVNCALAIPMDVYSDADLTGICLKWNNDGDAVISGPQGFWESFMDDIVREYPEEPDSEESLAVLSIAEAYRQAVKALNNETIM